MNKTENQKAWLFVLPVVLLVAFNAIIPLMTVVNYSVQETFGDNTFFWSGVMWFEQVLRSERFHDALGRQLFFTFMILVIEVPLGVAIALTCGLGVYFWSGSLGLVAVIAMSMVLAMVAAGFAGAVVPIVLKRLGQDPAQSSSIVLTTVTDVAGFFSFLGIATLLMSML